ncbi:MAG: bifunctional UDP-N-acetylglucosamine diphosphorylase/glucosamine-1-phosphate N-acetyltransferase GlmU [Coxiellaceae bacterium]|jgi:bifunctional UDP-N-acetylglucosamine pyrophosphorylase/glucosamine-1-phosphate N-acetyltransferase|nr:bifunctional UDP-N-acetylglucosamine diphosphorylase/glucosamine-1-phosphate N-acetyltransferase GlmU [Coxiellaceae bacterium]
MNLHIVILAAGKSTRMHSSLPKILHLLGGKPLLEHVIITAQNLRPKKIHVVYNDEKVDIREYFSQYNVNWVKQSKRLGTGHAVMQVLPFIKQMSQVLILYGDVPLITSKTLEALTKNMPIEGVSLLSAEFSDPTGLGRIIRNETGVIEAIVEHKDVTPDQLQIKEINSGILVTTSSVLRGYLPHLNKHNAQGEYYLTDVIAMLYADNISINSLLANDPEEVIGVNDQRQLVQLERRYQRKLADALMARGLYIVDPARFDVRGSLTIDSDIKIDANVIVEGKVDIGSHTTIGPNNFLKNAKIGKNVVIKANCVIEDAVIANNCVVGPFARIRPNTCLENGAHIGNFIELKNTKIGKSSKAHHVGYLGDTTIGKKVNIGAGTITCNYDGVVKQKTVIEDGVFVGSLSTLVAPVKLKKNAYIGAGSVITDDAPANELTLGRARQVTIKNWKRKNKKKR